MLRHSAGRGLARGGCRPRRSSGPHHAGVARRRPAGSQGPVGVASHRKGFGQQIKDAKKIVECLGVVGPEYGYKPARMGPRLTCYAVPEDFGGGGAPLGLSSLRNSHQGSSSEPSEPNLPGTEGLRTNMNTGSLSESELKFGGNPESSEIGTDEAQSLRYGLKGISKSGLNKVKDATRLMNDFRSRCCLWTVTLPDGDYEELAVSGLWPLLQRRIYDFLARYLREHGDPALVIGVTEIGEERLRRTGKPMPHLHLVSTGYGSRLPSGGWLLNPAVMDRIVGMATASVGLGRRDRSACSRLEPIRHSVSAYLGKYLTKTGCADQVRPAEGWESLIPRQWWNRSDELHKFLLGHVFHLPPAFVAFVLQQRKRLEQLGICDVSKVVVGVIPGLLGDREISLDRIHFRQPEYLLRCLELFGHWLSDPSSWNRPGWGCSDLAALARHSEEQALSCRLHGA